MAKPKKKSNRLNEIVILLVVLVSAALIIVNTAGQIADELKAINQQDTDIVAPPVAEPILPPTVLPNSDTTDMTVPFSYQ